MSDFRYQANGRPDQEREKRMRCLLRGTMVDERNIATEIVIRNVSRHGIGAAIRQGRQLRVPQNVAISLPNDVIAWGETRWISEQNFGVLLEHEIDADRIINANQRKSDVADACRRSNHRQTFLLRD